MDKVAHPLWMARRLLDKNKGTCNVKFKRTRWSEEQKLRDNVFILFPIITPAESHLNSKFCHCCVLFMQHPIYIYTSIKSMLHRDPELGPARVVTNSLNQVKDIRKQGLLLIFFAKCIIIIRWKEMPPQWGLKSAAGQYIFHVSNLWNGGKKKNNNSHLMTAPTLHSN